MYKIRNKNELWIKRLDKAFYFAILKLLISLPSFCFVQDDGSFIL